MFSAHHVPCTVLNTGHVLCCFILTTALGDRYKYYSQFTDRETMLTEVK